LTDSSLRKYSKFTSRTPFHFPDCEVVVKAEPTGSKAPVSAILGLGLDGDDGHRRITQAEDVLLLGGSEETHEQMQETVIKVAEALDRKGKRVRDAAAEELADLIREARK
jgi:hypothetical protein